MGAQRRGGGGERGGTRRDARRVGVEGGRGVGWRLSGISRCAEKSEHMAVTGGIWPRFFHQDGCQTKATCVTGSRGAQSTPGWSINTMCATPHQFGGAAGHWAACVCTPQIWQHNSIASARQQVDLLPSTLVSAARNTHVLSLQSSCRLL